MNIKQKHKLILQEIENDPANIGYNKIKGTPKQYRAIAIIMNRSGRSEELSIGITRTKHVNFALTGNYKND